MPTDANAIVVAGNGTVRVAPVGTTEPTTPTATPGAAWLDLGFVTEDGVTFTDSKDIEDVSAWQSFYPVRKIITGKNAQVEFGLRQWDERTVGLALGATITQPSPAIWKVTPPGAGSTDFRALMIDWVDGIRNYRLLFKRGMVTEAVETNLTRTDSAVLPITFAAVPANATDDPYTVLTDDIAFSS